MALTSLLVCADTKAVQILTRILADLGISTTHCTEPETALARLVAQQFDTVLVDCKKERAAFELIASIRTMPTNKATLVIGLVDIENKVPSLFAKGANFVFYKPISAERAGASLRAARSLMRRERRRHLRVPLHAQAAMAYAGTENLPATLLDMSEEGIAIQCDRRLPPHCKVYFQFSLPGHVSVVRLSGEVMWQDSSGRVGIRFVDVPHASRRMLSDWLRAKAARHSEAGQNLPSVSEHSAAPIHNNPLGGLELLSMSGADRREKSRYACRIGADVYRLGSNVPQRCDLSDISNGGCYVETTDPFPAASAVEIVVHTQEMKLRVQGTVQAMHPGFGMGVAFKNQSPQERDQVQQLIAFHAEETAVPT